MQGRFKKDGGAAGDPEPRGGTEHGAEPRPQADDAPSKAAAGRSGVKGTPAGGSGAKGRDRKGAEEPVDVQPPVSHSTSGKHASRLALRNWSIRTRLVSLLALPVVAATTLGGLRIQSSLESVNQLDHMQLLTEITGHATKLADALQEERDSSAGPIVSGHPRDDSVVSSRHETDQEEAAFKSATRNISTTDQSLVGVRSTVDDIGRQLASLKQIRDSAYSNTQYISQTVNSYNQLITSLLALTEDMAQATSNADMIRSTRALAAFTSAKEYDSIQRAVISAALADPHGPKLSPTDRETAQNAKAEEASEEKRFSQTYGSGSKELLTALTGGGNVVITQADQYRDEVLKSQDAIGKDPKSYLDWYDEADTKMQEMSRIQAELLEQMQQRALTLRSSAQRDAAINGALILLVLGISLIGAFVVARSMIRSLRRLQDTAQEVAQKRLPDLVKQLSESDPQDLDTSVAEIGINTRDEIGRVARAFDDVHREAVRLAAEQALLRGNVNAMFTNLSRRSQGLIQRQLSLISELESREADPDQLSNLFKLDHLATRMRRNGENLLVLAGEEPGRRWTRPVPLVDVLRAAASEVEQYERIELTQVPPTEVAGRVVNDLVHLLAELLENATSFSSPQTKVRVTGHALPDGRVLIEIHDTGIGLSPEDLADTNERLANPPTVDVSVSRRMGLFVVGRLSLRHGIRIQLRPSDSGGTTALVMLPVDLTQGGAKGPAGPQGKRAVGGPGLQGAPAGPAIGRAAQQLGAAAAEGRGQVEGAEPRPALPGAAGPSAGDRGKPQQRGTGLPTRQPRRDPQPAAQDERPATSWAQPEGRGPDVPRGHDDVRGTDSTAQFERPDFHGEGRRPGGSDQFFNPQGRPAPASGPRHAPRGQEEFAAQQEGWPAGQQGIPGQQAPGAQRPSQDSTTGEFFRPPTGSPQPRVPRSPMGGTPAGGQPQGRPPFAGQDGPQGGAAYPADQRTGEFQAPFHAGSGADVFGPGGRQNAPQRDERPPVTGSGSGSDVFGPRGRRPVSPQDAGPVPQQPQPQQAFGGAETGRGSGGHEDAAATARFPAVTPQELPERGRQAPPQAPAPQQPTPRSAPQDNFGRRGGGELPPSGEPMALPPAASPGDGRSPIFESLETDWFRQQAAARGELPDYGQQPAAGYPQQGAGQDFGAGPAQGYDTGAVPAPPAGPGRPDEAGSGAGAGFGGLRAAASRSHARPERPAAPQRPQAETPRAPVAEPQRPQEQAPQRAGAGGEEWQASPNDERWRRAEQVREPAAGGITPSGLPRRVPRANLVAGAAQQTPQTGPQVSRAPDDVRGRLTNLRRGIQQGRTAGAGRADGPEPNDYRSGTTHQQER
ncbi:nitrate- and nitrite sensing domain-containing protein [Streptomyces sp. SL13]|uniref:histidine kinase n=1 Tax=Streptantibioticus silvisoli TaxID=2705255 RepID=A0AA90KF26_9ACTN|nr:nitrate- and nitrite sensing domain-containing protein [Streptantibioticus silvisoli]MDI5968444.1 nitrate- and nitrite sensing domain-containing protein [Streptantibioticus silvisoli]